MGKEKQKELEPKKKEESAVTATPVSRALSPFEEMDRMFDNFFGRRWPRSWMRPFQWEQMEMPELPAAYRGAGPKVDVVDQEKEIMVRAEVPGVNREDLEVSVTDNAVTLRGCTRHEEKEEKGEYFRSEIARGEFTRTVALPSEVEGDKAKAKLQDGVLTLTLPKVAKASRKTVKID